jgi:DNA-binding NtrC family response regulator
MIDKQRQEVTGHLRSMQEQASRPKGCVVYVSAGPLKEQGKSVRLEAGQLTIGRDMECDFVLEDPCVSRRHARLSARPEGILIEDLGSTNGIMYLDKRIERVFLDTGTRIHIGRYHIDLLPCDMASLPLSDKQSYGDLIGNSLPMRRLYRLLQMLETNEAPVLISGETGTGKELVARALFEKGLRSGKPFVVVDCSNLPSQLMESEMFGHRKGSFTGAVADRQGAFESADEGTIFLDEFGELPLDLQPKLLRVLETGQIKRLGDTQHTAVNVRIIAATKHDLATSVDRGLFREDLYYRVSVIQLGIAPLRERKNDIPQLVRHFINQIDPQTSLPPEALEIFLRHSWPGNVRELRNAIQRTLVLGIVKLENIKSNKTSPAEINTIQTLSQAKADGKFMDTRNALVWEFEHHYLSDLQKRFENNISAAARHAGLDRKHLRKLLRKHGLYKRSQIER